MFRILYFLLCGSIFSATSLSAQVVESDIATSTPAVVATIDADVHADYLAFIGDRDPLQIKHYGGEGSRRDVIEVLLLQQALALGGIEERLEFRIVEGYLDSLNVLARGDALLRATPAWGEDCVESKFHIGAPVIRLGEFQVGLYTRPNTKIEQLQLPLKQLTAVTNHDLKADLHTLQGLGIAKIFNVERWPTMIAMVATGEADVILAPFQDTEGMVMTVGETQLLPVPEVKVALADSRHWIASRVHPRGDEVSKALARGLALQRQAGTITRAYTETGFFHPAVSSWALLNPVNESSSGVIGDIIYMAAY